MMFTLEFFLLTYTVCRIHILPRMLRCQKSTNVFQQVPFYYEVQNQHPDEHKVILVSSIIEIFGIGPLLYDGTQCLILDFTAFLYCWFSIPAFFIRHMDSEIFLFNIRISCKLFQLNSKSVDFGEKLEAQDVQRHNQKLLAPNAESVIGPTNYYAPLILVSFLCCTEGL